MNTKTSALYDPRFRVAYQKYERHFTELDPVSMTHQAPAAELDINYIVARHDPEILSRPGALLAQSAQDFADVSQELDYQSALHIVMQAESAFADLPARLRERFENDPGRVIEFISNPENHEECVSLGLAIPKVDVPPVVVPETKTEGS